MSGRPSRRLRVWAALFLLVAAVGVAIAVAGGWDSWAALRRQVETYDWRIRPAWLVAAGAAGVVALLATGWLWAALYRAAGGRVRSAEAAAAWLGSNLARYLPGKVWQLTGIAAYLRARGDSGALAFAVSLALQAVVLGVGAGLGIGLLGGVALGGTGPWAVGLAALAVIAALHPRLQRFVMRVGSRLLREPPSAAAEPAAVPGPARLALAAVGALAIWALYGLGFWALVRGLAPAIALGPVAAAGIFAAAYVIGYLVLIAPGGAVVREGAIAGLLGAVAGVPLGPATALALAARVWSTGAELVAFGLASSAGLRSRPRDR